MLQEEQLANLDSLQLLAVGLCLEGKVAEAEVTAAALCQELASLKGVDGTQLRRQLQDTQMHLEAVEVGLATVHALLIVLSLS